MQYKCASYKNISRFISDELIFSHTVCENFEQHADWVHVTDSYEVMFFLKTTGLYTVEDKTYDIPNDTIIITHPGQRHILSWKAVELYERYHMRFNPNILPPDFPSMFPKDFCVFSAKDHPVAVQLFESLDIYCKKFEGELLHSALISAVSNIMFYFLSISKNEVCNSDYHTNRLMSKVIEYVDKNIHEPINLEKLSSDLFVSKSYLHHIFVDNLKISPKKYIMSKKLYLAQKDIRSGKSPTSVYGKYGFTNYSSFYRAYVNHVGYPPSDESRHKDNIIDNFIL